METKQGCTGKEIWRISKNQVQVNSFASEDPVAKQKGIDKKGSRSDKSSKNAEVGSTGTLHNQWKEHNSQVSIQTALSKLH